MRRAARDLLLGLLLSTPLWAQAPASDPAAEQWLARMQQSSQTVAFRGTLVYLHDGQIDTLDVQRAPGPEGGTERLVALNGPAREVRRSGGEVTAFVGLPGGVRYSAAGQAPVKALPQGLYRVTLAGTDRVAGLPVQVVQIEARDAHRYSLRLWLSEASALPLRVVRVSPDGRIADQSLFVSFEPQAADGTANATPEAAARPEAAQVAPKPAALQAGSAQRSRWPLAELPPGFTLAALAARDGDPAEHHLYSDGLAQVSVFIEPLRPGVEPFSGPTARGAVSVYGRVMGGVQITVVGDVPPETVERFARAVRDPSGADG